MMVLDSILPSYATTLTVIFICPGHAPCSQPLSINQGLHLTSKGDHNVSADPTTAGTHLPEEGKQKTIRLLILS